jgi:hypothetical protein
MRIQILKKTSQIRNTAPKQAETLVSYSKNISKLRKYFSGDFLYFLKLFRLKWFISYLLDLVWKGLRLQTLKIVKMKLIIQKNVRK